MAVPIMRISEMYDKDVYTDAGDFFGKVSDVVLGKYMVHGWIVRSTPSSLLQKSYGSVRAVVVPHKAVKAAGDIMIISHSIEISRPEPEVAEEATPTQLTAAE